MRHAFPNAQINLAAGSFHFLGHASRVVEQDLIAADLK